MAEVALLKEFTPGAAGVWVIVAMCALTLIKGWPALKKIGLEADASLRGTLLSRIELLEEQAAADRIAFSAEMAGERKRCEDEIREIKNEWAEERRSLKGEIDALLRMIQQNSKSTAYMLGHPDSIVESKTQSFKQEGKDD